jgi:hypothetical protein
MIWLAHGAKSSKLAAEAVRDRRTHLSFLEALLAAELKERERNLIERRLRLLKQDLDRDGLRSNYALPVMGPVTARSLSRTCGR